ncbi:hypothetical protein A2U01_0116836, partial [Trifolium medium]|nr:hypothetical protein [Trifolium medium]
MAIPNKGDTTAADGGVVEATQSSPKKCKTSAVHKGRTMALTS